MSKILVSDAVLSDGGHRIDNTYTVPPELRGYFTDPRFYAEYPRDVSEVPRSILNIPALSTVAHFAVAVGADVEVQGDVDETYLKSCAEVQGYLKTAPGFESLKCISKVSGKPVKTPRYDTSKQGLLFSGGSDSTCSWVKRIREEPNLYMVWGLDVPTRWPEFWEKIRAKYVDELRIPNLRIVKSNTEDLYALTKVYTLGAKLTEGYRPTYSFSVNALGLLAPLTYLDGVGLLQLSSTYPSRHYLNPQYPWARYRPSFIVNQFWRWGSTRCVEVDHEYSTLEKIETYLKPHVDAGGKVFLRSCGHRVNLQKHNLERQNCLECDKCGRTISILAVAGVDPREVGFPVEGIHWARCRSDIEAKRWNPIYLKYHFEEVRDHIPAVISEDYAGSKGFMNWLRGYTFK